MNFNEYYVSGVGTIIDPEGEPGYRVRLENGAVTAYPSLSGEPSEEKAAFEISHAIENPPRLVASSADIKAEAQRRILLIAPAWKQSNMIARVLELVRDYGTNTAFWPVELQAENAQYQAIWERIKATRAFSDILELNPPLLSETANQSWPE